MKDMRIRKMVFAALMAALTYVATMVVQIPSPMQGYVNLGDCCVLLSGWMLGPWWGGAAAGIGSMLTDLLNGYAHYAPGTFVIKGCMAIAAALLAKAMGNKAAGLRRQRRSGRGHYGSRLLRLCRPAAGQWHRAAPASPATWCRRPWVW